MKQNTKTIVIAGAALAGVYLISQSGGEQAGGFGGGGGVPLLPGDVSDAAAASDSSSAVDSILDSIVSPSGFLGDEGVKKTPTEPTSLEFASPTGYVRSVTPSTGLPRTTGKAIRTTPKGTGLFASLAASDIEESSMVWWNPLSWDRGEIVGRYGEYSNKTWGITPKPEDKFFGGGKSGGEGFGGSWGDSVSKKSIVTTTQRRSSQPSSSAGRGYSRMGAGVTHSAGWKQMGAKKPTAPGKPDRY